ncbi:MAG: riboflavin synthase [Flavobacteriales bacterium]
MFTGIIETLGTITAIQEDGDNVHFTLSSGFTHELQIDQSVAHNGVCLTVIAIEEDQYTVTAIKQTLRVTSLKNWAVGDKINLERCMQMNGRLDGHIVQGHVDKTAFVKGIKEENGSWFFNFYFRDGLSELLVEKGSVTVNGVSLTVVDTPDDGFSVAIIPYTFENTCFHTLKPEDEVNIEFDIIGKYVQRMLLARS